MIMKSISDSGREEKRTKYCLNQTQYEYSSEN